MSNKMDFTSLLSNKVNTFISGEMDYSTLAKYQKLILDELYFDFVLASQNGGFFYGQALHIYGYTKVPEFHSIDSVNVLLDKEYGNIFGNLIAFGQDLFGNQFCFDKSSNTIILFNSETGERETLGQKFDGWVRVLYDQLEYLTGIIILENWNSNNHLEFGQRLYPKIPFIMGGEYGVKNLYAAAFPAFLKAYANIARQVYNLPDGTKVKLKIDNQ